MLYVSSGHSAGSYSSMAPADSLFPSSSIDFRCCILYFCFCFCFIYIFLYLLCLKRAEWDVCTRAGMGVRIQSIRKRSG